MKNLRFVLVLLLGLTVLFACEKDDGMEPVDPTAPPTTTDPNQSSNLSQLFEIRLNQLTQTFSFPANSPQTLVGNQGTRLSIPANAFVDGQGNPVTGTIQLELIEVMNQADMILTNMPTTSGGEMLISGGEINIQVFQNGQALNLANGVSITVGVQADTPDWNMALFNPELDNNGNFVDWVTSNDSLSIIADTMDSSSIFDSIMVYSFNMSNTNLGWINCDYFSNDPAPRTDVIAVLPTNHDISNSSVFLHVTSANSVMSFWGWDQANNAFGTGNFIPVGMQATIVAISEINGQYYSAFVPITVAANQVENITFTATTYQDLVNDLNAL